MMGGVAEEQDATLRLTLRPCGEPKADVSKPVFRIGLLQRAAVCRVLVALMISAPAAKI